MGVVQSCEFWIKENKLNLLFERKILTKVPEDPNGWWNGLHIMVLFYYHSNLHTPMNLFGNQIYPYPNI